jgi:protein-L-isoaspartate O-methyltransferase
VAGGRRDDRPRATCQLWSSAEGAVALMSAKIEVTATANMRGLAVLEIGRLSGFHVANLSRCSLGLLSQRGFEIRRSLPTMRHLCNVLQENIHLRPKRLGRLIAL